MVLLELLDPLGLEPISCFCSMRQLDVQVHPLDMTPVRRKDFPRKSTLDTECQAGRLWVPFLTAFGMTRPGNMQQMLVTTEPPVVLMRGKGSGLNNMIRRRNVSHW